MALTTQGSGWWVVVMGDPGEARATVERRASDSLLASAGGDPTNIYNDTWQKNLQVLSYSAAMRAFPAAMRHWQYGDMAGILG